MSKTRKDEYAQIRSTRFFYISRDFLRRLSALHGSVRIVLIIQTNALADRHTPSYHYSLANFYNTGIFHALAYENPHTRPGSFWHPYRNAHKNFHLDLFSHADSLPYTHAYADRESRSPRRTDSRHAR
jgi:hypothetical protein